MPELKRPKYLLILILLISALIRCGLAVYVQRQLDQQPERTYVIEGDADGYWRLAQTIVHGEEYSIYTPPRRVLRMPGFPLVLAGAISVVGEDHFRVRLVLALSGMVACYLVYLLGKELTNETTGLIAAGLTAVSPVMAGFSILFLSETIFAIAMLISLLVLVRLWNIKWGDNDRLRGSLWSALAGVTLAAAFYVRPSWLLILPIVVVLMFWGAKGHRVRALERASVLILGFTVMLVPWVYRNFQVTGHFVPTTLWAGPSLYDGLNPRATGDSDMTFFDRDRVMLRMSEYEMNRYYTQQAVEYARQHPGHVVELMGAKLLRYWKPWPNAPQFRSWWMMAAVSVVFLPVLLLAVYGAWISRSQVLLLLITVGPILYFSLIHLVFVSSLRYRLPAEYSLYILSAVGLTALFGTAFNKEKINS
ncbi:hypothetical protein Pan153_24460 [Gimesia panareensis]|uniref:Glycosyltransferase RgtA/B/C/D-like domain-containing protein n=1 Tax=Gimesia panareensis TaxID=2527978 RepID=A0A518FN71_9PLAN|nr:hypothetical protein Pan153_24460 [Gimesia panareensis]